MGSCKIKKTNAMITFDHFFLHVYFLNNFVFFSPSKDSIHSRNKKKSLNLFNDNTDKLKVQQYRETES